MILKAKTFTCLACGKEQSFKKSCDNKYCSNECQQIHRWGTITKPRIERGECTSNSSKPLIKYLKETRGNLCSECGLGPVWNEKPLTLQLDHIDGNSDNNYPSNLRLLCPNCHTQTDTHGAKGAGNTIRKETKRNNYIRKYRSGT